MRGIGKAEIPFAACLPMSGSLLAEMAATAAISSFSLRSLAKPLISLTARSTALVMPRLMPIGSMPAATALSPSLMIA